MDAKFENDFYLVYSFILILNGLPIFCKKLPCRGQFPEARDSDGFLLINQQNRKNQHRISPRLACNDIFQQ